MTAASETDFVVAFAVFLTYAILLMIIASCSEPRR